MIDRARALVPRLRDRAARTEELRRLPPETERDLHDAGLFRIVQPKRVGGAELDYVALVDCADALAQGDASVAWNFANLASHHWMLGMFDRRAQDLVWNKDPDALIASSFIFPSGRASKVDGGYRLRGHWPFSSGVNSSEWNMLGGVVSSDDEADGIEYRIFLLHKNDYEVTDTWNASGLRGTGIERCRSRRCLRRRTDDGGGGRSRGRSDARKCRQSECALCAAGVLAVSLCAVRRGAGQRAGLPGRLYRHHAAPRVDLQSRQARRLPEHADQDCRGFREDRCRPPDHALAMHRGDGRCAAPAASRILPPRPDCGATGPIPSISAPRRYRCCLRASGARGLFTTGALQRQFRDAHAINSHLAFNFDAAGTNYGRVALGLPSENLTL